jgi:hypothetical protein
MPEHFDDVLMVLGSDWRVKQVSITQMQVGRTRLSLDPETGAQLWDLGIERGRLNWRLLWRRVQLRQLEKQLEQNQLTPEMKKVLERLRNEQLTNHERFEAQKLEVQQQRILLYKTICASLENWQAEGVGEIESGRGSTGQRTPPYSPKSDPRELLRRNSDGDVTSPRLLNRGATGRKVQLQALSRMRLPKTPDVELAVGHVEHEEIRKIGAPKLTMAAATSYLPKRRQLPRLSPRKKERTNSVPLPAAKSPRLGSKDLTETIGAPPLFSLGTRKSKMNKSSEPHMHGL